MSDIHIENYERYKIELDNVSLLYYPSLSILNIEFWDSVEEDDVEVTIWDDTGYHLENSPIQDISILEKYLQMFKEIK